MRDRDDNQWSAEPLRELERLVLGLLGGGRAVGREQDWSVGVHRDSSLLGAMNPVSAALELPASGRGPPLIAENHALGLGTASDALAPSRVDDPSTERRRPCSRRSRGQLTGPSSPTRRSSTFGSSPRFTAPGSSPCTRTR